MEEFKLLKVDDWLLVVFTIELVPLLDPLEVLLLFCDFMWCLLEAGLWGIYDFWMAISVFIFREFYFFRVESFFFYFSIILLLLSNSSTNSSLSNYDYFELSNFLSPTTVVVA